MPFTIPNAENPPTYAGQAVLDSTDILALAAVTSLTGVSYGCTVSAGSGLTVNVVAGVVQYQGVTSAVSAATNYAPGGYAASSADRRDIVVASNAGAISITQGTPCSIAAWTYASGYLPPVKPAIPASSILLAELYIPGSASSISAGMILDKTCTTIPSTIRSSTAYNSGSAASITTASSVAVSANANRIALTVTNNGSAETVYLSLGGTATTGSGIRLNVNGGTWTTTSYAGAVEAICTNVSSGTSSLTIAEV
jgi:hypothetical protein